MKHGHASSRQEIRDTPHPQRAAEKQFPISTDDRLFPLRHLAGLFAESRSVWKRHRRWMAAMTGLVFFSVFALRPFDTARMDLSIVGEQPALDNAAKGLSRWGEFHLAPFILFGALALGGWLTRRPASMRSAFTFPRRLSHMGVANLPAFHPINAADFWAIAI